MNWDKLEFTNHDKYIEIAKENIKLSRQIDTELLERFGFTSSNYQGETIRTPNGISDVVDLYHKVNRVKKCNIVSVVFTALAAESFINFYAITNGKDDTYLRTFRYRDGLSETVVKWIQVPFDITGSYACTSNSPEVHNLQTLFTNRNKLAHHKATIIDIANLDWSNLGDNILDPNSITSEDANIGYEALNTALLALKAIDDKVDLTWLDN